MTDMTRKELIKILRLKPLIRKMKLANVREPKLHSDQTKSQIALAHWDRIIIALETLDEDDEEGFAMQAYSVVLELLAHFNLCDSDAGKAALNYFGAEVFDENFLPWPRDGQTLEARGGRRPMSEAPKDGTVILATLQVKNISGRMSWQTDTISFDEEQGSIDATLERGWAWEDYEYWLPIPSSLTQAKEKNDG